MGNLSCSFTLGKPSNPHGANIAHNNREFISPNVDITRTADNITYIREDIRDVYDELFGEALTEYNSRQTRKDRRIDDYYEHISSSERTERFTK